ncbi:hypothetical protein GQ472_01960 [archaeon]|nr:hypothetical protein [archaeon]
MSYAVAYRLASDKHEGQLRWDGTTTMSHAIAVASQFVDVKVWKYA